MDTSIVGVGVGISDRFRSVVEEKAIRIEHLAPRAQRVDVKVTHRAYHNGRMEDETVELTVTGKGPLVRAEATDGDKFTALDLAVDKLCEQLRRAKDKRVDARNHPRGAKFQKDTGALHGIDVQPASADMLRAVATGEIPVVEGEAVWRVLAGINRLLVRNIGLRSVLNRSVSFTMHSGADVYSHLTEADLQNKMPSNLFGFGFRDGEPTTAGCSGRGRLWAYKVAEDISEWVDWT